MSYLEYILYQARGPSFFRELATRVRSARACFRQAAGCPHLRRYRCAPSVRTLARASFRPARHTRRPCCRARAAPTCVVGRHTASVHETPSGHLPKRHQVVQRARSRYRLPRFAFGSGIRAKLRCAMPQKSKRQQQMANLPHMRERLEHGGQMYPCLSRTSRRRRHPTLPVRRQRLHRCRLRCRHHATSPLAAVAAARVRHSALQHALESSVSASRMRYVRLAVLFVFAYTEHCI